MTKMKQLNCKHLNLRISQNETAHFSTITIAQFLTWFFLVFSFLISPNANAQLLQCENLFSDQTVSTRSLIANTLLLPVKAVWNPLSHHEQPRILKTKIYSDIQTNLPQVLQRPTHAFLYASLNIMRKFYNVLSVDGLGLPIPSIPTHVKDSQKIQSLIQDTYLSKLIFSYQPLKHGSNFKKYLIDKLSSISSASLKFAYKASFVLASSLYAFHSVGNALHMVQSKDVIISTHDKINILNPLKENQIEILNETTPFPHLAIRIGNTIYSHGTQMLTAQDANLYLSQNFEIKNAFNFTSVNYNFESLTQFIQKSSARSIDSVVLNLDTQAVQNIRSYLNSQTGKSYKNTTFVNSCSSMIARILKDNGVEIQNTWLDASPSLIIAKLAIEKSTGRENKLGQPLIDQSYTLNFQPQGTTSKNVSDHKFRNFIIRQLESGIQLQVHTFAIGELRRFIVDQKNPNTSDLYIDSPERQQALKTIYKTAEIDLTMIADYELFQIKMSQAKSEKNLVKIENLKNEYRLILAQYINEYQTQLNNTQTDSTESLVLQFKIEILQKSLE